MQRLREKLTYANVIATLALVLAIGGGGTAIAVKTKLPKNSVTTKAIKPGAVKTKSIGDGQVSAADLAGIRIAQITTTNWIPALPVTVKCAAGERPIGGGALLKDGDNSISETKLLGSYPIAEGWAAEAATSASPRPPLTVYALCLAG